MRRLIANKGIIAWVGILLLPLIAFSTARIFHKTVAAADVAAIGGLDSIAWPSGPGPQQIPAPVTTPGKPAPIETLISGLAARLAAEPNDPKGWALLAQSYAFLGDASNAEAALDKAVALGLDEDDLRRRVSMASMQAGGTAAAAPVPSSEGIAGVVRLDDGVVLDLPREARLFITAKATDGSPAPIAVLGSPVMQFPYEFSLTDANSMLPGIQLSNYDEVALSARISRAGTAMRSAGDLESDVEIVRVPVAGRVELVLKPD